MACYAYKAMDGAGRIVAGRLDAANPIDLERRLSRMELDYIDGAPVEPRLRLRRGAARRELIDLFFHLGELVRAGVPVVEALADLRAGSDATPVRAMLTGVIESIEGGKTLSQAMAEQAQIFDEVTCSLVRVGEASGKVPEVLAQLVAALKWQDELAAQTRRLLLYPAFLGATMLALTAFMMIFLVPKLAGFMTSMGKALPLHTEILIAVSGFFVAHWPVALLAPVGSALALNALVRTQPRLRLRIDAVLLRLPWLGRILTKIILARFANAFAMMYASGISILDALRATEQVVGNAVVAQGLRRAGRMIAAGERLSTAFQDAGLFPPLVVRMLRVGENTGALDTALANVGYFYGRDVREAVERAQVLVEPALTVLIGLVIGWIMLSVFGPIYDIVAGFKV